jgi:hypothetical protein
LYKPSQTNLSVDAFIVWDHIYNFIEGSFSALQMGRFLSREEYLGLGRKACRLEAEKRQVGYDALERYEKNRVELQLWDDVDEVQDYLRPEIALFYMLLGPGDLVLAGDTAQNVVEGVDFRFEDNL